MTIFNRLANIFTSKPTTSSEEDLKILSEPKYRIVVIDFQDNIESTNGENTANVLRTFSEFEVIFFAEPFNKDFLNLESRNLFDLIDKGQNIIDNTGADVLV